MPISTILLSHQTAVCMHVVGFCVSFDFSAKPSIWGRYAVVCCFMSIDCSANLSHCSRYAVSCFVSIEFSINQWGSTGRDFVGYLTLSTKPSVWGLYVVVRCFV